MVQFKEHLETALENLQVLFEDDCTHKAAMSAWKKVFSDKFFDDQIVALSQASIGLMISSTEPTAPVQKEGDSRFG
jgi:hypothetical protein